MRRLPHRRVVHGQVAPDRADHHLAAIEPDPDVEGHPLGALDLGGILLDRGLHRERRVARPHGMVRMGDGRAEQRHNAVPHDLVHGALVAMDRRHHAL
jgi:hypothetical protein